MAGQQVEIVASQIDKQRLGYLAISLTNYNADTEPQLAAASKVEIGGALFEFTAAESITGWAGIGNNNGAYIKLVVAGTAVTAAFTTTAPTWSTSKQGWYDGLDRYVAKLRKDGSGNYTEKRIPEPIRRGRRSRWIFESGSAATFTVPWSGRYRVVAIGGGGGGGASSNAVGGAGGGGGGGGYSELTPELTKDDVLTYTVGAGGTAGVAYSGNGGAGGNTTVTDGSTTITAGGGGGGSGGFAGAGAGGGQGATTKADHNTRGGDGGTGVSSVSSGAGGDGGGGPSVAGRGTAGAGTAGVQYGGGGAGSYGGNYNGGAGAPGVVIIETEASDT
jgi:hypothetical protein